MNSYESTNCNCKIVKKLDKLIKLKEMELKQQRFFIELIEEVLPIDDNVKRRVHERTIRGSLHD